MKELVLVAMLSWLTGTWQGEGFEERWGPHRAGTMLGTSRATSADKTTHLEFMLLQDTPDGVRLTLHLPETGKTMVFKLVDATENEAIFERADPPEQLIYRRSPDGHLHIQLIKATGGFRLELSPGNP